MNPDGPRQTAGRWSSPRGVLAELIEAPVIRPAAVARGRALLASGGHCPADAVASRLVEDLVSRRFVHP